MILSTIKSQAAKTIIVWYSLLTMVTFYFCGVFKVYHSITKAQVDFMANPPNRRSSSIANMGRTLMYVLVLCLGAIMVFKYFQNTGSIGGGANYTSIPKELQINYVPSDFNYEMDEESTLAILSNPHRYRREFNELVYNFNLALLHHVSNRMNLPDSLQGQVQIEYEKHHPYLRQLYFNDFTSIRDTSGNLYESWYNNEHSSALDVYNEVASKYTCFLVNHVIMALVESEGGKLYVKGNKVDSPCGIALTEALKPMMVRLQNRASIMDFSRSKGLMEEKVERVIAELATMEVRDKKAINKQMQTKIWGYSVSSTDIEISAISLLKVGFKLDDYFDVNLQSKNKTMTITLPEPVILSHEVYPKIDKLDIGWLRELKEMDINMNFNMLRSEFRRDALNSDIMARSKTQAEELMNMIFQPLLAAEYKGYKIKVNFKKAGTLNPELATEDLSAR